MASPSLAPYLASRQRISLAAIDAAVSARLGPTRRLGNSHPACFNPQVAMYLAKNVGRWTTTIIGRFYNGRNHSTVCYGIQRIEALRESDPDVDGSLLTSGRQLMTKDTNTAGLNADDYCSLANSHRADLEDLAELIAARVCAYIQKRTRTLQQNSAVGATRNEKKNVAERPRRRVSCHFDRSANNEKRSHCKPAMPCAERIPDTVAREVLYFFVRGDLLAVRPLI